jgi:alkyl hydroperoxide reductase subunit AhpC
MTARPLEPTGPKIGALLPDFTVRTLAGRTIHRRDFKGRRHLVLCFAHAATSDGGQGLATALATAYPAWRAERAELLLIVSGTGDLVVAPEALPIIADAEGHLRARFGVGTEAALFIADRYGEIAFYENGESPTGVQGLPLDQVLPTLELLEMRCSL